MPRYNLTPSQVAAFLAKVSEMNARAAMKEQEKSLVDAWRLLIQQSSGTVTTAQLRKMKHPFARRAPQSSPPANIINSQSGAFKRKWKKVAPVVLRDQVVSKVVNTDKKARFMHGTKKMVPRRVVAAAVEKLRPIRRKRQKLYFNREIARVLSGITPGNTNA